MDVHPTKNGINRYWSIPTSQYYWLGSSWFRRGASLRSFGPWGCPPWWWPNPNARPEWHRPRRRWGWTRWKCQTYGDPMGSMGRCKRYALIENEWKWGINLQKWSWNHPKIEDQLTEMGSLPAKIVFFLTEKGGINCHDGMGIHTYTRIVYVRMNKCWTCVHMCAPCINISYIMLPCKYTIEMGLKLYSHSLCRSM